MQSITSHNIIAQLSGKRERYQSTDGTAAALPAIHHVHPGHDKCAHISFQNTTFTHVFEKAISGYNINET